MNSRILDEFLTLQKVCVVLNSQTTATAAHFCTGMTGTYIPYFSIIAVGRGTSETAMMCRAMRFTIGCF